MALVTSERYRLSRVAGAGAASQLVRTATSPSTPALSAGEAARLRLRLPCMLRPIDPQPSGLPPASVAFGDVDAAPWPRATRPTPLAHALEKAKWLFIALGELHDAGVVLRDVRPENVLLGHGRVWIVDLSAAVQARDGDYVDIFNLWSQQGDAEYLAPELAGPFERGLDSPPSDLYSAGVMLYQCLAGTCDRAQLGPNLAAIIAHRS
jgi:hypothetical protein